jgi:protein involved in sex pheromone biosynthesis
MKKKMILTALAVALFSAGCSLSVDKETLTDKANELKQQAEDTLNKLKEDAAFQQKLMATANASQEQVTQFLADLMQSPTTKQAIEQLGYNVVQNVIQQQLMENNGIIEGALLNMIQQELERRMQNQ